MTLAPNGIRVSSVVLLALGSLRRHLPRGVAIGLVAALAAAAVVATSGRTDVTRRAILDRLEAPSARLITMTSADQTLGGPAVVERIAALGSVEWILGLSKPGTVGRNPALGNPRTGNAGTAVGTLTYWGDLFGGPLVRQVRGRAAGTGEALVGERASVELGLADHVGTVEDKSLGALAVVGAISAGAAVDNLNAYVLVRGARSSGGPYQLLVLAKTSSAVEPLADLLPGLLDPAPRPPLVERASQLVALQADLASEVGQLDLAVLAASLGSSMLVVAVMVYASGQDRRREFGLRRSQGATRSTIGVLLLLETGVMATLGAFIGAAVALAAVAVQTGATPDIGLALSAATLVALTACLGSAPPALVAAYREPLYVLRAE